MPEDFCPCKRTDCLRHGDCTACREYHHTSGHKPLTRCEMLAQKGRRKAEKQARRKPGNRKKDLKE